MYFFLVFSLLFYGSPSLSTFFSLRVFLFILVSLYPISFFSVFLHVFFVEYFLLCLSFLTFHTVYISLPYGPFYTFFVSGLTVCYIQYFIFFLYSVFLCLFLPSESLFLYTLPRVCRWCRKNLPDLAQAALVKAKEKITILL